MWATVKSDSPKIQALCSIAGLKIEMDSKILKKILESKYPKYKGKIETNTENDMLVFRKIDKPDYPQIMLRS